MIWFRTFISFLCIVPHTFSSFVAASSQPSSPLPSLYVFQNRWFFSMDHCLSHQLRSGFLSGLFKIPYDIIVLLTLLSLLSLPSNLHIMGQHFLLHLIILLIVFYASPWVWFKGKKCGQACIIATAGGSPGGSVVKNPPAKQETGVPFLGREDPPEEVMATPSSILVWKIPWTLEPGGL